MLSTVGLLVATFGPVDVAAPERSDCPSAASIASDIETLIGASAPPIEVRLELRETATGVIGELEYTASGRTQTRAIPGFTCEEVANAAAVVVAVGVDPVAVQRTVQPILQRPTQEPPPLAPPPALPSARPAREREPGPDRSEGQRSEPALDSRPTRRPSLGVFARGGVGVGALPNPAGWVGGGLGLGLGGLRIELSGQHLFAREIRHAADESTGADVSLTSGRVGGCWTPRVGAFTLGGCLGVDVGAAVGEGFGLENTGTASTLWVAATPGLRAHWHPTRRVALGLVLDVPISFVRPLLSIDDFTSPLVEVGVTGVFAGMSFGFTFFDESSASRR